MGKKRDYSDEEGSDDDGQNRFMTRVDEEKPMSIWVYKNGEEFDPGVVVHVTRRNYRNWVALLDYLTGRLRLSTGAVHHIFTLRGKECRHFRDLEDGEEYIAAAGRFIDLDYGKGRHKRWNKDYRYMETPPPAALDSNKSLEMYLEKNKFKPMLDDMWDDTSFDLKKGERSGGGRRGSKDRRSKGRSSSSRDKDKRRGVSADRDKSRRDRDKDRERDRERDKDDRRRKDDKKYDSKRKEKDRRASSAGGRRSKSPGDYYYDDYDDYTYYRRS